MGDPLAELPNRIQAGWRRRRRAAGWMALGTALLIAAAVMSIWGAGLELFGRELGFRAQYFWVVGLVLAWMMAVGKAFNGHLEGLLIDGRNRISLSRLQLFVWLVIVGCAFGVEVAHNFDVHVTNPEYVNVPRELGLVMGVATTSFVASPAILSLKARRPASASELATARRLHDSDLHPRSGRLFSRKPSARARWSDLFRGEELETSGSADPAKIQQFLVTLMLATIYLAGLWRDLSGDAATTFFKALPGFSDGGLALLGVSHAAYLGGKMAPQTPGGPAAPRVDTVPQPQASAKPPPPEQPAAQDPPADS